MFKNITFLLLVTFFSNTAFAKMYKCQENGKTTYQAKPCKNAEQSLFLLKKDISKAKQKQAALNYEKLLKNREEKQRLAQEKYDKERLIRAEELKALAAEETAYESHRQADALEEHNKLETSRPLH